jgi:sorbitol-specific phosphotransferase system component IIA
LIGEITIGIAIIGALARAMKTILAKGVNKDLRALAVVDMAIKYMAVLKIKYQLMFSPNNNVVAVIGNGANGRFENSGNQDL